MARFEFNEDAFEKAARKAVGGLADDLNGMLARMATEYAGRSVDEIKPVLAQRWRQKSNGGSMSDSELSEFAAAIAEGRCPTVRVRK